MLLPDFKDFPVKGRVLGVDWGAKRTGIAITDESRQMVFVRPVINPEKNKTIPQQIADLVKNEKVVGVVFGLPLHGDGSESETAASVRACVDELLKIIDIPVCLLDEYLTSTVAQESMGRVRRNDIKQKLDSESARVILENAISMIKRQ